MAAWVTVGLILVVGGVLVWFGRKRVTAALAEAGLTLDPKARATRAEATDQTLTAQVEGLTGASFGEEGAALATVEEARQLCREQQLRRQRQLVAQKRNLEMLQFGRVRTPLAELQAQAESAFPLSACERIV